MDKISVFGATGFIGSNFCRMYPDETEAVPRDIISALDDTVLYLISTTHNYHVLTDPTKDINTNLADLMAVLWYNRDNKDLVFNFTSSWFVYSDEKLPAWEGDYSRPKGFYSITKQCAENLIMSFCKTYGLKYRIFRLANVLGVDDKGVSAKKNALQFLIEKMAVHEPIQLYYGGRFRRDYIHVDDVCRAMKFCMDKAPTNEIINIGSGDGYWFHELIRCAHEKLGSKSTIEEIEPPDFHKIVQVKNMQLEISKLKGYGYEPSDRTIYDTIDEIIENVRRT